MKKITIKIGKILGWFLFSLVLILLLIIVTIQIPYVQNKVKDVAISFVQDKIGTPVSLERIEIAFPKKIVVKNLYVESQEQDTLLYTNHLGVDISLFALLKNTVSVNGVQLDGLKTDVKRDSTGRFNFDYIVEAFASEEEKEDEPSSMKIEVGEISLSNIEVKYNDDYDGHHVKFGLKKFITRFKQFDLDQMKFAIPKISIAGIDLDYKKKPASISSQNAIKVDTPKEENNTEAALPNVELGTIEWTDSKIQFDDEESKMYAKLALGNFQTTFDHIDLVNQQIDIKEIRVDDTKAIVHLLPLKQVKEITAVKENGTPKVEEASTPWKLGISHFALNSIDVKFDNSNFKSVAFGLDPNHIEFTDINFDLKDFQFSPNTITGNLEKFSFKEKSGLQLNQFKTYFLYGDQTAFIKDFLLETPNSKFDASVVLNYKDVNKLKDKLEDTSIDVKITESHLGLRDIYLAMPTVFEQVGLGALTKNELSVDVVIKGLIGDLSIEKFLLTGLNSTAINVNGNIKGATKPETASINLNLNKFQTSAKDIFSIAPKGVIPNNIAIPAHMFLSGNVKGNMKTIDTKLALKTTSGNATVDAFLDQRKKGAEKYSLVARLDNLKLGEILKNDSIGVLSMSANVAGTSFNPDKAQAKGEIKIDRAEYNGYNYNNIVLNAALDNSTYKISSINDDPNLNFGIDASGKWTDYNISLDLLADFKHIDLYQLKLVEEPSVFKGKISTKLSNVTPDDLDGSIVLSDLSYTTKDQVLSLKPIEITAINNGNDKSLALNSELIDFDMQGQYKLTLLADLLTNTFKSYFDIDEKKTEKQIAETKAKLGNLNHYFTYNLQVKDNSLIHSFIPELKELQPINFKGRYESSINFISFNGVIPAIQYGENVINNISLDIHPEDGALTYALAVEKINNASVALRRMSLEGDIKDNKLTYNLNLKDKTGAPCYLIAGDLSTSKGDIIARLHPDGFMLDYQKWVVNPENRFVMKPNGFFIKDFELAYNNSLLAVESRSEEANSPMKISFKDFSIETLTKMVKKDVLLASGFVNGEVYLKDLATDFRFISDIDINKLHVMEIGLGNLHVGVKNESASKFVTDVVLQGGENKISIDGWADADTQEMNMNIDLTKFQMGALEYFAKDFISETEGYFSGNLKVGGKFTDPKILGTMDFNNVGLHVNQLNADFKKINERISFTDRGIELDKFSITDVDGNILVIDGQVLTKTYKDYAFNLSIKAVDFKAVNSTSKDNDMYYGKLVFDSDIKIKGDLNKPIVTGGIEIGKKTNFSFVLPQEDPSIADREGIVEFVDEHSLQMAELQKYQEDFNNSALKGLDVSVSIKVDKEATFTMIMDKSSGDKIVLKGEGDLVGGIDPSGKVTLAGRYEFSEGSYDLSFNMLKRRFEVEKGSYILWAGDPTDATMSLTAIYETKTAPIDLLGNQLSGLSPTQQNMYKQKIPFQALLKMKGELLKPEISFDVQLKEGITSVSGDVLSNTKTKLEQLRQNESEMNKQVFALLLLNRFIGENPFESSAGGASAGTMARQSVSRLLSDQLNNLASNLISGVELNFNLESSEDFSTGNRENRTDLNVAVSKRLFSDRLKVTVGSSFEVEGNARQNEQAANIAGDIELEYALSQDGRYLMRVYRKNRYEVALQGQIVETGVGFIITMSYEKFRELFERSKDKRQLKKQLRNEAKAE
ncbi:translocation/assembly module TamB domain-containing protein [Myroides marinus]|uniref:translocation/assembly module TamB domain-containing protein n=1 Tax=Myroides marinus TaxID=703342 RepID=UPI002577B043|nr:translocation/assembly module TamB [Myroides marinus]MDM1404932.1 translocation/assembly module TamB domain-containing protein [Myroides marinus]